MLLFHVPFERWSCSLTKTNSNSKFKKSSLAYNFIMHFSQEHIFRFLYYLIYNNPFPWRNIFISLNDKYDISENKSHCICLINKIFDSEYGIALILVFFDEATNAKAFFLYRKMFDIIISAFIDCFNILKGSKETLLNVQKNPVRRNLLFQSLIKMLVIQSQKTK